MLTAPKLPTSSTSPDSLPTTTSVPVGTRTVNESEPPRTTVSGSPPAPASEPGARVPALPSTAMASRASPMTSTRPESTVIRTRSAIGLAVQCGLHRGGDPAAARLRPPRARTALITWPMALPPVAPPARAAATSSSMIAPSAASSISVGR